MTDTRAPQAHFYLKIDGTETDDSFQRDLLSLTVDLDMDQPGMAVMTLDDARVHWRDLAGIKPGAAIEVLIDADTGKVTLFKGEIVGIEPVFTATNARVTLRAYDLLHRLTRGKKSKTYQNVSDGDILNTICGGYGFSLQSDMPQMVHEHVYQHNQTDLEFLRTRASRFGRAFWVVDKTLHVQKPATPGPELELEAGKGLSEFHARMSTSRQVDGVTVRGWDAKSRREFVGKATSEGSSAGNTSGKNGAKVASEAHGVSAQFVEADQPISSQEEANAIANAQLESLLLGYLTAEGVTHGNPAITPGVRVSLTALGDRFSGKYLVTGVSHRYAAATGYTTEFRARSNPSSGLFTILTGQGTNPGNHDRKLPLAIGLVTDNQDPEDLGRVKVKFPWFDSDNTSWWARVVAPGAGKERGMQFLPEVDDEVLVGFEHGDMRFPYVLGGLWNGVDKPPLATGDAIKGGKVEKRVIKSRSGHTVTLDDAPSGGGITIEDPKGNKIFLDTQQNTLKIEVSKDIEIKAGGNVKIEASGNLEIKASGQATVQAGATLDLKGSIVNVN